MTDTFDFLHQNLRIATEFQLLSAAIHDVGGFLTSVEGYALYLLANMGEGEGAIVEIGSFEGKSTIWLALGSKNAGREHVTAVDTFAGSPEHQKGAGMEIASLHGEGTTYNQFLRNIEAFGIREFVNPVVARSEDAAKGWAGPIRLLFIDGEHSYEAVSTDFQSWSDHVIPGGYIAFHDYGNSPDVQRFCDELAAPHDAYEFALHSGSVWVVRKR